MTIQELGSLGELIAAIATVAMLVYVAIQIRQNTHMVRAASTSSHIESASKISVLLGQNRELCDLYFGGLSGQIEMDESQRRQYEMLLASFIMVLQQAYILETDGVVHPEIRAYHHETLKWLVEQPGFRSYWDTWGPTNPPLFRNHVDEMFSAYRGTGGNSLNPITAPGSG